MRTFSNFWLQYQKQYEETKEEVKEIVKEAAKKAVDKCPNCGALIIFSIEMPSFKDAKVHNPEKNDKKPSPRKGRVWLCNNCGFIWTDQYVNTEYSFTSKKNNFQK